MSSGFEQHCRTTGNRTEPHLTQPWPSILGKECPTPAPHCQMWVLSSLSILSPWAAHVPHKRLFLKPVRVAEPAQVELVHGESISGQLWSSSGGFALPHTNYLS